MSLIMWSSSLVFLFFGAFVLFGLTWPKPTKIGERGSRGSRALEQQGWASAIPDPGSILGSIAEGSATGAGVAYLDSLARSLAMTLGTPSATIFVAQEQVLGRFRSVAHWQQPPSHWSSAPSLGVKKAQIEQNLFESLARREVLAMPAAGLVPTEALIAEAKEMEAQNSGVLGRLTGQLVTGIVDSTGQLIGLVSVMDDRSIAQDSLMASVIRIYSDKASAELERLSLEEALEREMRQRKEVGEDLRASYRHLRDLAHHLQSDQEDERSRIAEQIHDELGQSLTAIKMDLSWLLTKLPNPPEPVAQRIQAAIDLVDGTVKTVRHIATELRPRLLDELGLVAAIEWQARDYQERSGLQCRFSCTVDGEKINPDLSTAMFRCFQELLTNVVRHAEATWVEVSLDDIDNRLVLSVVDNGKGFSVGELASEKSFGLRQIQERAHFWAGHIEIERRDPKGAAITVIIPLDNR